MKRRKGSRPRRLGAFESLDVPGDPDVEKGWLDEIERRLRAIDRGTATLLSWEDARRLIRG